MPVCDAGRGMAWSGVVKRSAAFAGTNSRHGDSPCAKRTSCTGIRPCGVFSWSITFILESNGRQYRAIILPRLNVIFGKQPSSEPSETRLRQNRKPKLREGYLRSRATLRRPTLTGCALPVMHRALAARRAHAFAAAALIHSLRNAIRSRYCEGIWPESERPMGASMATVSPTFARLPSLGATRISRLPYA